MDIKEVMEGFSVKENVAIDIGGASDDEIYALSEVLTDMTKSHPFDHMSFERYMFHYRESYPLMVSDGNTVSSYVSTSRDCREYILTVWDVLEIFNANMPNLFSDEDFSSVFDTDGGVL